MLSVGIPGAPLHYLPGDNAIRYPGQTLYAIVVGAAGGRQATQELPDIFTRVRVKASFSCHPLQTLGADPFKMIMIIAGNPCRSMLVHLALAGKKKNSPVRVSSKPWANNGWHSNPPSISQPVSSRTSRANASNGCSPASEFPPTKDQNRWPALTRRITKNRPSRLNMALRQMLYFSGTHRVLSFNRSLRAINWDTYCYSWSNDTGNTLPFHSS